MSGVPIATIAVGVLETMKVVKALADEVGVEVSQEYLNAQSKLVDQAADEAERLTGELPHDRES